MKGFIFIFHMVTAIILILLVLFQSSKHSSISSTLGNGASSTMFGSIGSISFFAKCTVAVAIIFFITSIILGIILTR